MPELLHKPLHKPSRQVAARHIPRLRSDTDTCADLTAVTATPAVGSALGEAVNKGGAAVAKSVASAFAEAVAANKVQAVADAIAQTAGAGYGNAIAQVLAEVFALGSWKSVAVSAAVAQAYTQVLPRHWCCWHEPIALSEMHETY